MARSRYAKGDSFKAASLIENALRAFIPSKSSADMAIAQDREMLALRSRALFQNHAFSRALIKSFDVNVVGTGVKARPALSSSAMRILGLTQEQADEWCNNTRCLFEIWANDTKCDVERNKNFYGIQDLALKTELIGGEVFILKKFLKRAPFGLALQVLEGDRVVNPLGELESDRLCEGIEVDGNHCPVAYHFTKKVPFSLDEYTNCLETVRVPAFDSFDNHNVIHLFEQDRPCQRRGIPMMAPIIIDAKQSERFKDARLMKALVTSLLTVVFTNKNEDEPEAPVFTGDIPQDERIVKTDEEGNYQGSSSPAPAELGSGNVIELPAGQDAKVIESSKPDEGFSSFMSYIHDEDCSACGVSAEVVSLHFQTSYNAVRAALHGSAKTFNKMRGHFITKFCKPVYEAWLTEAVLTGVISAPGFDDPIKRALWCGCTWVSDAAFMLDPYKETQAIKMQLDEQLTTRADACASLHGTEYRNVVSVLAAEKNYRRDSGLQEPGAINKSESFNVSTDDTSESDL